MNYAQIRKMDISNGEGIGVALFCQGCEAKCFNCFNPDTWDFDLGNKYTEETKNIILDLCNKNYITRLSLLGGEPLHPKNIDSIIKLSKCFKELYPNKKIWIWTGYLFKDICNKDILNYADYIIDGRYIDNLRDYKLKFRGSSNQRIWNKINEDWRDITDELSD